MSHSHDDRRKEPRIPLDSLYFINISFNGKEPATCLVLDISSGGLMLGLPPGMEEMPDVGCAGMIVDYSPEFASFLPKDMSVTIMWVREDLAGLSFEQEIEGVALASLLSNKSE